MATTIRALLDDFISDMEAVARLRPNTVRAYRYELEAAAAQLTAPLGALTLAELERWASRGGASASTVGRRLASFSRLYRWARRHQLCTTNPLDDRTPARTRRSLPRPIQAQRERDALDRAIGSAPQPYRLMLLILRETGIRAGEVVGLQLGDVLLDAGREGLRLREPKNGVERIVPLGAVATPKSLRGLRAHLKTLTGQPAHAPLFRSNRGTRVSYDALHYRWAAVCAAAGLVDAQGRPSYTLHQLRHTRGAELIAQGQPLEVIQRVLGHRDPRSTQRYAELSDEQVRAALEGRR